MSDTKFSRSECGNATVSFQKFENETMSIIKVSEINLPIRNTIIPIWTILRGHSFDNLIEAPVGTLINMKYMFKG